MFHRLWFEDAFCCFEWRETRINVSDALTVHLAIMEEEKLIVDSQPL